MTCMMAKLTSGELLVTSSLTLAKYVAKAKGAAIWDLHVLWRDGDRSVPKHLRGSRLNDQSNLHCKTEHDFVTHVPCGTKRARLSEAPCRVRATPQTWAIFIIPPLLLTMAAAQSERDMLERTRRAVSFPRSLDGRSTCVYLLEGSKVMCLLAIGRKSYEAC